MEQYTINRTEIATSIIEGKFFRRIHHKHIEAYGDKGAKNIVANVRSTYSKLMKQLATEHTGNHNSLLVGKVQSGKTSNLELLTALAFDNGYNLLIIFGGYDKDLLRQSTERFGGTFETTGGEEVLYTESPVLFTTNDLTKESLSINSLDPEFAKQLLEEGRPMIITCLKRPPAMKTTLKAITKIQESVPGIVPFIIDDEGISFIVTKFDNGSYLSKMIIPKEIFIEAYKRWIKGDNYDKKMFQHRDRRSFRCR